MQVQWRRWLCVVTLGGLLIGCRPDDPLDQATLTPAPMEAVTIYIGTLQTATPSTTEDVIALVVGETRVRAALCSLADQRWQALDTWFGQGERNGIALSAESVTRKAALTAKVETPQLVSGDVKIADGTTYHFQAQQVASTADYEAGKQGSDLTGVYTVAEEPLPDGRLAIMYAVADPAQSRYCGMLLYQDQPVTRILLRGTWQASFSEFTLPDPIGADKATLVWNTPRHILRIEGILRPSP